MVEYVTRESARSGSQPSVAVWFETVGGTVSIQMSADGLLLLQSMLSEAISRLPVDSSAAAGEEDRTQANRRISPQPGLAEPRTTPAVQGSVEHRGKLSSKESAVE